MMKATSIVITEDGLLAAEKYLREHSEEFENGTPLGSHSHFIRTLLALGLRASGIEPQMPPSHPCQQSATYQERECMSEELAYWHALVNDLQGVVTIAKIAEAVDVEPRQVWRWKAGEDKPKGLTAIKLHTFHMKLCPARQWPAGHSQEGSKA